MSRPTPSPLPTTDPKAEMSKSKQHEPRSDKPQAGGPQTPRAASASRREALRAQQAAEAQRARTRRIITAIAVVLAVVIVAVVVVVLVQNRQRQQEEQGLRAQQGQVTPPSANDAGNGLVFNNSTQNTGKPSVEVYLDFQCPGCAQASALIDPLLEQLADSGEIQLTYHMLHGLDRGFPGNHSYRAALAATCADVQGAFPVFSKAIFAAQPATEGDGWTDEQLRNTLAVQTGLSGEQLTAFQTCFDSRSTSDFVDAMQDLKPDYVTYTPFFAVNGNQWQPSNDALASADALLAALQAVA